MKKKTKKSGPKNKCASALGRKGGLKAKRLKLGIHSPSYKRKAKSKKRK